MVRFVHTKRHGDESDSDEEVPPPPTGHPKLYHTSDFIAKFAAKDLSSEAASN